MTTRRLDGADALVGPLYFVALLLIGTPVLDFITSILPFRLDNIEWRFASVGLLSGFVLTPLLGIVLTLLVAYWAGHVRLLRIVAIANAVVAVAFTIVIGLFLLDIVQLRSAVQAEAQAAFEGAAFKAVLKHVCFVVATGLLAIRGFRSSSWSVAEPRRQGAAVIIGS
ncbi:MAG: hypothetical protein ACT4P7_01255 [Gemmatimonadaceae bacterium]